MIDRRETISILRSFVSGEAGENPVGLYSMASGPPLYADKRHSVAPICAAGKKDSRISYHCKKFCEGLDQGEGRAQCPYGITVEYFKKECVLGSVGIFVQRGFQSNLDSTKRLLKDLPRQSKKMRLRPWREAIVIHSHIPIPLI